MKLHCMGAIAAWYMNSLDRPRLVSLTDFKALEETSYLLRVPKNARRLLESLAELEKGGGTERTLAT